MPDEKIPEAERYVQLNGEQKVEPAKVDQRIRAILSVLRIIDREKPSLEALVAITTVKAILEESLGEQVEVRVLAAGSVEEIRAQQRMLKERYERTGSLQDPPTAPASSAVH